MHRGFNLTLENVDGLSGWVHKFQQAGQSLFNIHRNRVIVGLENYTNKNGVIDGSQLQGDWFPEIKADVFISHSHSDTDTALALAGWLSEEFKLSAFVDSAVWGYGDDLLRQVDNKYCYDQDRYVYSYEKRNKTTAHIHSLLNTALTKMIDRAECLVFLNTQNSVSDDESAISTTRSAWLFSELTIAETIRTRPTGRAERASADQNFSAGLEEGLQIRYLIDPQLSMLARLDSEGLRDWARLRGNRPHTHALDLLYNLIPERRAKP